jgi:alpha-L-rhamnosidase
VEYRGRALKSRERCWWCVQVWDQSGIVSEISDATWWEMGLLRTTDWSAQWLAAEDAEERQDREAGLHWIWEGSSAEEAPRKFRYSFKLPAQASGGELIAVVNDWFWFTQITRICIDGAPVAGPGAWVDYYEALYGPNAPDYLALSRQRLALPAMSSGEHLIAVEVTPGRPASGFVPAGAEDTHIPGFALFMRVTLDHGQLLRVVTGSDWKTSLVQDLAWHEQGYNDENWSAARLAPIEGYQPWPAQPATHLRRTFSVKKPVRRARLYAAALGAYEARLNGHRVGDALLTPEASQYAKRVLYRAYDVGSLLQPGTNALGLTVGDGWYASFDGRFAWGDPPRRVIAQLEVDFVDGSRQVIATGADWRITQSPILISERKDGEVCDARCEHPGWDTAGFDDAQWASAAITEAPPSNLVAHVSPPIRATQTFKPRVIMETRPGVYVVDFGLNFSGWCRIRAKGTRGTRIELRFAENVHGSGEIDQSNMRDPTSRPRRDIYIFRGDPSGESFEPHFGYTGFRYVEITGLEAKPTEESVQGVFIHSDLQLTGRVTSDSALIEQIWRCTLQSQRSNFVGIPTDNPSREARGWMAEAGVLWDAAAFNMDICAFTSRHMDNIVDEQAADGALPLMAPQPQHFSWLFQLSGSSPAWGDAGIALPWTVWRRYGDVAVIERNWGAMSRYIKFIHDNNPDFIWKGKRNWNHGDWLALDDTPRDLFATAYWAYSTQLLAQMGEAIGRTREVTHLRELFGRIRDAFSKQFVRDDGTVGTGSQTGYVLALKFGLLSDAVKKKAADRLAEDIRRRNVSLTTGVEGTQFVLDVLADAGFSDLAYSLLLRTEKPSWGYMIGEGATTIWETWAGDETWCSRNQPALGSVCGFLFRRVAGIDAAAPGFGTILIRPVLDKRVKRVGAEYDSVLGRISTVWSQREDGCLSLDVSIPANASARIHLPARPGARIEEGRREISGRRDIRLLARTTSEALLEIGSGSYSFMVGGS